MNAKKSKLIQRKRRHARIRARVIGTSARPRLSLHRSLRGIFAQLIDDTAGITLVSVGAKEKVAGDAGKRVGKVAESYLLGKAIAEKAKAKGVTQAVFDRGGYRYHGRVAAFADGARDGGLQF